MKKIINCTIALAAMFLFACNSVISTKNSDGSVSEYSLCKNLPNGIWRTYNPDNGLPQKIAFYSNGKKLTEMQFYPDGQPKSIQSLSPDGKIKTVKYDLDAIPIGENEAIHNESLKDGFIILPGKLEMSESLKIDGQACKIFYEFQSFRDNTFNASCFILPENREGSIFGKIRLSGRLNKDTCELEDLKQKIYYGNLKFSASIERKARLYLDLLYEGNKDSKSPISLFGVNYDRDLGVLEKYKKDGVSAIITTPEIQIAKRNNIESHTKKSDGNLDMPKTDKKL